MKKKFLSLFLIISLLLSFIPFNTVSAVSDTDYTEPTIFVGKHYAASGSKVDVNLYLVNNPGLAGARVTVSYNSKLTLTEASSGETFAALDYTNPGVFTSPCNFTWDSENAVVIEDGILLTLTFEVSDEAAANEELNIDLSYRYGDMYNEDLESLDFDVISGNVTVINYIPGDVNDDGTVNGKDITLVRRYYAGGYGVTINEAAADVNDDGTINGKDITLIRRYNAGGYGVELKPSSPKCNHSMIAVSAKNETCTENGNIEYWYCSTCDKYFNDADGTTEISFESTVVEATGHTEVTDSAVAPTYTTTGLTEGSHCLICGTIIKEQQLIPVLKKNEYSITYHIANNDTYLAGLDIDNSNPSTYTSEDGLVLADLTVSGYTFLGWYDGAGSNATLVKEMAVGEKGSKVLYAHWEKVEYVITFDSPDVPVASIAYTVDTGATLTNPEWFGYTFVGWSNDNGFIVSSIKPGTTGNITLHANWTSNRNKATSYSDYGKPIIIEDSTNGQFLFVYNIGKIDNVPLSQIEYIGNTQSLNVDKEYEITDTITSDTAETIANTVSNATTRSSGWTLSEEWNDIYEAGSESENIKIKTDERTDSEGNVVGGNYFVSNSSGGSSYISTESGGSDSTSSKITTDSSKGLNKSYDSSTETYADGKLNIGISENIGASASVPVKCVEVGADIGLTISEGVEFASGKRQNNAFHVDEQKSKSIGTEDVHTESSYYKSSVNNSSTWNSSSGYEKSHQTSRNSQISSAISEQISNTTSYNVSNSLGGQNSQTASVAGTDTRKDEYSTTLKYSEGTATTTKKHITYQSDRPGYYRLVTAGTVHVYGVVGYDVATASYFTYTFNVLDDERHEYLDYSKDNANFNDCENGVVAFEVPYGINEYVVGVTGKTEGLEFDLNGNVTGFEEPENFDGTIVIPQYYSVDNGDGTYSAYKTKGFDSDVFTGNINIKTVVLPVYVTEIPDNAFEGCVNLESVLAFGVTAIGNNAFKNCVSLDKFLIDNMVTSLGKNSFENVSEIAIMAANSAAADATTNSGAKKITINLSNLEDSYDNQKIMISDSTDYFALISNGNTYNNLQVESNASETFISNMTFANNTDTPLKLNSEKVTLSRVNVIDAPGFALILPSDETSLYLFGTIELSSLGENAVISKSVTLDKANTSVSGKLELNGDYLVCGEISNVNFLTFTEGEVIQIDEETFNSMLTSSLVSFDANGGIVLDTQKIVYYGQAYGSLPIPSRDNYTFVGWYTAQTEGTEVTSETIVTALVNQTLYAHWTPNTFTLFYDVNGEDATVSATSKTLTFGDSFGTLPTPTRDYYTFNGWYTSASGGEEVSAETTTSTAEDVTIYAQWTQNSVSGWTKASSVPSDAQIVDTKWTYTLREYTQSSSSSLSGYTKYDTQRTSWGTTQGPVYSNPSNGSRNVWSEEYEISRTHYYHYYRWAGPDGGSDLKWGTYTNYESVDLTYQLTDKGTMGNNAQGYRWYYNGGTSVYRTMWLEYEWDDIQKGTRWYYQEPVYTYYYYRDLNKESASDPTGQSNVSNIVKYVKYRAK